MGKRLSIAMAVAAVTILSFALVVNALSPTAGSGSISKERVEKGFAPAADPALDEPGAQVLEAPAAPGDPPVTTEYYWVGLVAGRSSATVVRHRKDMMQPRRPRTGRQDRRRRGSRVLLADRPRPRPERKSLPLYQGRLLLPRGRQRPLTLGLHHPQLCRLTDLRRLSPGVQPPRRRRIQHHHLQRPSRRRHHHRRYPGSRRRRPRLGRQRRFRHRRRRWRRRPLPRPYQRRSTPAGPNPSRDRHQHRFAHRSKGVLVMTRRSALSMALALTTLVTLALVSISVRAGFFGIGGNGNGDQQSSVQAVPLGNSDARAYELSVDPSRPKPTPRVTTEYVYYDDGTYGPAPAGADASGDAGGSPSDANGGDSQQVGGEKQTAGLNASRTPQAPANEGPAISVPALTAPPSRAGADVPQLTATPTPNPKTSHEEPTEPPTPSGTAEPRETDEARETEAPRETSAPQETDAPQVTDAPPETQEPRETEDTYDD